MRPSSKRFAAVQPVIVIRTASCSKQRISSSDGRKPHCPSGGIGRHKGLIELSSRGETPGMTPVKVGEDPGHVPQLAELTPNQARRILVSMGRRREQTAGTYSQHIGHGEGVLQTTNVRPFSERRRKPKWYENPSVARSCRFESGLGYHNNLI